jgi:maleylpyruvate isomerase
VDASLKLLHDQIDDATALLLESVARLSDDDVRQPSLLPGWTRGHVLTHIARGGDALRDVLAGGPGYPSREARAADIEAGAGRGIAEQVADIRASAAAFRDWTSDTGRATGRPRSTSWNCPSRCGDNAPIGSCDGRRDQG